MSASENKCGKAVVIETHAENSGSHWKLSTMNSAGNWKSYSTPKTF